MIESIRLRNFRRFDDQILTFEPGVNLIEGVNNAGKSTILYAIEYALFGHVKGFKTKSSYTRRGEKDAGVELIFGGRDESRYRLLRVHKLSRKSKRVSSSHFTLKRIGSDEIEGEEYVLSSDFGDTEEQLAFKMQEITGISRRLFEVTVSARQGEVPDILRGSSSLDIVLGATAAEALSQAFKDRKRTLEKDLSQIPILETLLEKLEQEKQQLGGEIQKVSLDKKKVSAEQKEMKKSLAEANATVRILSKIDKVRDDWECAGKEILVFQTSLDDIKTQLKSRHYKDEIVPWVKKLDEASEAYKATKASLEGTRSEAGKAWKQVAEQQLKLGNLEGQLHTYTRALSIGIAELLERTKSADLIENIMEEMKTAKKEIEVHEDELKKLQHERGDLEGRASRRKSVAGENTCEYCGAELDPVKVAEELKEIEILLMDLEQKERSSNIAISKLEKKAEQLERKSTIAEARTTAEEISDAQELLKSAQKENDEIQASLESLIRQESESKTLVDEKQRSLDEIQDLVKKESNLAKEYGKASAKLNGSKAKLVELLMKLDKLVKSKSRSEFMQSIGERLGSINKKDHEEFPSGLRNIDHYARGMQTEFRVKLDQCSARITELTSREENLKGRSMTLDADLTDTSSKLDRLFQTKKHTEKYGELADGFKAVQESIRENASRNLSESSLAFHKQMFPETEVERLRIRPDDYSMEIAPTGWDETVPVTVYQGGGMQLLLGLSYRLAIGDFLNGVPFLFADEPTYGADSENRKRIVSSFKGFTISNQTLLVTHQSDALQFSPANEITVYRDGALSRATMKKNTGTLKLDVEAIIDEHEEEVETEQLRLDSGEMYEEEIETLHKEEERGLP
ncbi:MAG: AAA family ATPase [Candidatus Thorarchaeota archaeon]